MQDVYLGYYPPSEEGFKHFWQQGIVVLDTNVLLNLYRVSQGTRDEVFDVLRKLDGRLWLPYQVGLEFHQRRLAVINEQHAVYRSLRDILQRAQENAERLLGGLRKDSVVDVDSLRQAFHAGFARIQRKLDTTEAHHPLTMRQAIKSDPVLNTVTDLFAGRIGGPPRAEEREELIQEARQRIASQVPPGYADAEKGDGGIGDVLLWRQLLDWASEQEQPILLVTDDQKEDWFRKEGSTIVGPRPELIVEMKEKADVDFHLYTLRNFLQHARSYLLAQVSERTLDEVQEVRRDQESKLRQRLAREHELQALLAERNTLRHELARTPVSGTDLRHLASGTVELQARLRDEEARRSEIQSRIAALGEIPGDDDSKSGQAIRHELDLLHAGECESDDRITRLRHELELHSVTSHRLADIDAVLGKRSSRLAQIEIEIDRVKELIRKSEMETIEQDRADTI